MAAVQIDMLAYQSYVARRAAGDKTAKVPKPMRRPTDKAGADGGSKKMGRTLTRYQILVSARGAEAADRRLAEDPSLATTYGDGTSVMEAG